MYKEKKLPQKIKGELKEENILVVLEAGEKLIHFFSFF